jgi:hypothetical protein
MKNNTKRSIKVSKDDTVSEVSKKKKTSPTSVTKTDKSTGSRKTRPNVSQKATSSEAKAQKQSGVSSTGAKRVKNDPQNNDRISAKKDRGK